MSSNGIKTEELRNEKEWINYKINDICRIRRGASPRPIQDYISKTGIPWVKISDATAVNSRYINSTNEYIKEEGKNKSRFIAKGTLILSNSATPGIPKIMGIDACVHDGWLILDEFISVTQSYLYYYFINERERLLNLSNGSVFRNLKTDIVKNYNIKLPPIEEQKLITKILSTLDEKIETNNQINKKLEEMAQAIFKQWFVDFEFPCIPENYKFSRASKPEESHEVSGVGKPKDFEKVCTYKRVGGLPVPDGESWFVYILLCEDETFYKGMTKDLYRSFYEHYTGIGAEYTKAHKPVKVIHYEQFATQQEARKREEELKSGYGREWIKREYAKYLQDEENIKQSSVENSSSPAQEYASESRFTSGSPTQEYTSMSRLNSGSPAREYTRKSKFMIAGEMVQSEIGIIPKGWDVIELNKIGNLLMGLSPKSTSYNTIGEGTPLLNGAADFNGGLIKATKYTTQVTRICSNRDLVFCIRATIGNITFADKEYCLGRGVASIKPKKLEYVGLIYMNLIKSMEKLKSQATGSVILGLSKPDINNMKLILPSNEILNDFSRIFNNSFAQKNNLEIENEKLNNLRDILLPKLMSGEIRVPINN